MPAQARGIYSAKVGKYAFSVKVTTVTYREWQDGSVLAAFRWGIIIFSYEKIKNLLHYFNTFTWKEYIR